MLSRMRTPQLFGFTISTFSLHPRAGWLTPASQVSGKSRFKSGLTQAVPVRVFAAGEAFVEILPRPTELAHPYFRRIVGPADPTFQVFKVVAQSDLNWF